LKILLIAVIVLIVLGTAGGGIFVYLIMQPQPFISVTSDYHTANTTNTTTQAGSTGTDFRISGNKFSGNSAITFLLDDDVVPGNPVAQSDKDGKVTTRLTVTKDWSVGDHKLTARDASGYTTKDSVALKIVPQGQASTPGPNGAPPDDKSFTVNVNYQASGEVSHQITLQVTGHSDPTGGSACTSRADGVQNTYNGQDNNGLYRNIYTLTCSGTYKGGKLIYTETLTSDKYIYANGLTCIQRAPYVLMHLEGTFSSATTISGSYSQEARSYDCTPGGPTDFSAALGNWTGQMQQ